MDVPIACGCPPAGDGQPRHPSDTVTLREPLDFRTRLILRQTIRWVKTEHEDATEGEMLAALTEAYLIYCIDGWTLVDAKGKPLAPSRDNIRSVLMARDDLAMPVADAADGLYGEVVLLPLLLAASNSSPGKPTAAPTSPTTNGTTHRPKRSRPSSTSTIQMVATGPMPASPAGVSST